MANCRFCGVRYLIWRNTVAPDPNLSSQENALTMANTPPVWRLFEADGTTRHSCQASTYYYQARSARNNELMRRIDDYLAVRNGSPDLLELVFPEGIPSVYGTIADARAFAPRAALAVTTAAPDPPGIIGPVGMVGPIGAIGPVGNIGDIGNPGITGDYEGGLCNS